MEPEHEALVTVSGRWTYGELDRLADAAVHAWMALGVGPGDRVAVSLPNDVDVVVAFRGAMGLGAVWVGINRALAPPEKAYIVEDCGASVVLDEARLAEWRDAVAAAPGGPADVPPVDPFAPAGIAYTSGTTGRPKGAVHSQHNLLLPGRVLTATRGWDTSLRKGDCLPLTILNMLVLTTLTVSQAGGTSVVMDRIDSAGVASWIRKEHVTVFNGPPALLHSLASDPAVAASDLSSLREVWTGGGDCPEPIRAMFTAKFGLPVLATYGLTEAPTVVSIDSPSGSDHRPGGSGKPLPHLDVQIIDDEICVRAATGSEWEYRPMLGYWNRPEATAEVLGDGWLHTGDVGTIGEDGTLFVKDRKNLVIIRGGANVYPAEVERVLHELPEVAACAVAGVPDERLGERVVAAVQLAAGADTSADQLTEHCRARLAKYKVPERFVFVDTLPRNAMGKIDRRALTPLFRIAQ